jgi:glycosyltransferase 2 family protein
VTRRSGGPPRAAPGAEIRRYLAYAFTVAVVAFVALKLAQQWTAVRDALAQASPEAPALAASCVVVLLTYALLIETWRIVLAGWGHPLPFWDAARIWTISNLGKYIPGKVWALSAMAVMSEARGVSPVIAASASVLITLINTVVGFVVVAATGADVLELPRAAVAAIALLGLAIVIAPPLLPRLGRLAGRLVRREVDIPPLPMRALIGSSLATAVAWIAYGVAFRLFVRGVLGSAPGTLALYVAIFAGSYLVGFVAIFAPGGIGVRETVMAVGLKRAAFATGPAFLVVAASRLWLTVLEILPALLFIGHGWVRSRRAPPR